jgi:hypothetical protein
VGLPDYNIGLSSTYKYKEIDAEGVGCNEVTYACCMSSEEEGGPGTSGGLKYSEIRKLWNNT